MTITQSSGESVQDREDSRLVCRCGLRRCASSLEKPMPEVLYYGQTRGDRQPVVASTGFRSDRKVTAKGVGVHSLS